MFAASQLVTELVTDLMAEDCENVDTKPCPFCGEEIKSVAVRCKHCQADLSKAPPVAQAPPVAKAPPEAPDFDRGVVPDKPVTPAEFEQRFLEFAYKTNARIDPLSVAHACKVPIQDADDRLEDMAAREMLIREVDDEGQVYFRLPGRAKPGAIVHSAPGALAATHVDEGTALVGLLVNLPLPGVGSLIAGKTREGVLQLVMVGVSLPLCFLFVGFPMLFGAWVWAMVTTIRAVNEAKAHSSS